MRCNVPGGALCSAKFSTYCTHLFAFRLTNRPCRTAYRRPSGTRCIPRFVSTSRVKKNTCGGVNVAIDPFLPPPATSTRFFALTVTRVSFLRPPNSYCCGSPPRSRQVTRGVSAVENPFSPPSYLYATDCSSVFAIASIRSRFDPR